MFEYRYETENRILAEESGRIENLAPNEDGLRSKGFYQYTGDDGVLYRVDYVADNNGFVPQVIIFVLKYRVQSFITLFMHYCSREIIYLKRHRLFRNCWTT